MKALRATGCEHSGNRSASSRNHNGWGCAEARTVKSKLQASDRVHLVVVVSASIGLGFWIFKVSSPSLHFKGVALCFLGAAGLLLASRQLAADSRDYAGRPIAKIDFVSDDSFDVSKLQALIPLKPGQILEPAAIRKSMEVLYQTRAFSYIEVNAEQQLQGVALTFRLRPNFFFADFRLGGDLVLKSSVSRLARLPLGEAYSSPAVEELQAKVTQALKDEGYYQAKVTPHVQFLSEKRLVAVEFLVQAGLRATIATIDLEGSPVLEKKEILQAMKLRLGRHFDSEAVKKGFERVRKLYSRRGFLNATTRIGSVSYLSDSNSVKLVLQMNAGSFVYVELVGAKISRKELRPLVPIYEEGSIDQDLIEEGRRNIADYFERRGFFDVSVVSQFIEVPADNAYQINYRIDRGERQKVAAIEFQGIQHFTRDQLLSSLRTKVARTTNRGKFSHELVEQDAALVRDKYLRAGFERVEVDASSKKDASGRNIVVTFAVKEGPQSLVSDVVLRGNEGIASAELLKGLHLAQGQPFSMILLDQDRQIIESKYWNQGFAQAKVESTVERHDEGKIRVIYAVTESEIVKVERIYIVGNRLTKDKVITRNINFREGDPLSQERLLTSQQKLYSVGLFNRVDIVPTDVNPIDERKPVIIRVEDGSPIIFGYGIGYGDREGPRGTVEISHNNLWGLARSISFRTRASLLEQRGQITYKEPRLFNQDLDSFLTLYAEKTRKVSFDTTRTNASLQVLKHTQHRDNISFRYSFETVDLSDIRVNPQATGQEGTLKLSSVSGAWFRDTRDDPFDPTRGFFNTASFTLTSKLIGSQTNFVSFFGQTQSHHHVMGNMVFATSVRLGLTKPYGSTPTVPISERFFAGGATTLRGFNLDCAGPLDVQPKTPESESQPGRLNCGGPSDSEYYAPLGGNALMVANLELRVPLTTNLSFAPFYDTGNVFSTISTIKLSSFTNTVGVGLRYRTPFGPLRVDLGFNVDRPPGIPNHQIFFTIGNPF
jgi:outer membrane protein assembly complex protein YaeT